jgi:dihydrofolate synthase/folylpolyglutamate synthase
LINISQTRHNNLHMVFGMVNDKNREPILAMLPKEAQYYFCKPDIPRGLDAVVLAEDAKKFGLNGKVYLSVKTALDAARKNARTNDLIFVGGSAFVVAEVV